MMYTELYYYLLQHKQLLLPGIGTFLVERKPAEIDFPNRQMKPPVYSIAYQSTGDIVPKSFFSWLAAALHISDRDAILQFNDFAFSLKERINNGDSIDWSGVGVLSKGPAGEIKFVPSAKELAPGKSVAAEKVIREKAEHMVRVGEEEKTSTEMVEMLNQPGEKRSYWWSYALVLAFLSTIFIGWYLSEHGLTVLSTANTQRSVPHEATATYKILP